MTKRYILPVGVVVLTALIATSIFLYKHTSYEAVSLPLIASSTPAEQQSVREEAWAIFQKYLAAAKNHNIAALKEASYKLSSVCQDASTQGECYSRMDTVYEFGKNVKETDVPHITGDQKQVMLYTDDNEHLDGDNPSVTKGVLYFARASDGTLKLASIQPFQGAFLFRDNLPANTSSSTISAMLKDLSQDSDGDLVPDETELCSGASANPDCRPTDPHKKDTDGDGWWDSIEPYIK